MTSWCVNRLVISKVPGRPFDADRVLRELHPDPRLRADVVADKVVAALNPTLDDAEVLSFERLLPTPDTIRESGEWFSWRVDYWGTQFDARDSRVVDHFEHMVALEFLSAWEAPDGWFAELSRQHPDWNMELIYMEENGSRSGRLRAGHGSVVRLHQP